MVPLGTGSRRTAGVERGEATHRQERQDGRETPQAGRGSCVAPAGDGWTSGTVPADPGSGVATGTPPVAKPELPEISRALVRKEASRSRRVPGPVHATCRLRPVRQRPCEGQLRPSGQMVASPRTTLLRVAGQLAACSMTTRIRSMRQTSHTPSTVCETKGIIDEGHASPSISPRRMAGSPPIHTVDHPAAQMPSLR